MDIIELVRDLGEINDKPFENCLLKKIPMEFYYILDIKETDDKIEINVMKREGNPVEIPKRIKLYEYAVNNKLGVSLSTFALNNKEAVREYLLKLKEDFNLDYFKDVETKEIVYIDSAEEFEETYNLKFRGYITVGIEGKLLVDEIEEYDKKIIEKIYKGNTYEGSSKCYICESAEELICGGIKEPGLKVLSITRTNEISQKKKEVFIRCVKCEEKIMKGFNLLSEISVKSKRGKEEIESMLIPLHKDINIFNQMKKLRLEHSSDLKYYETLERLFDRYKRRGLDLVIELVLSKKLKNITIMSINLLELENLNRLHYKKSYVRFLEDNGFKEEDKEFLYYPTQVIKSKNDMKWKFIEKIKRYWLGKENDKIWDLIGKIERISQREIIHYKLFNKFITNENLIMEIKNDKYYWLGKLIKELISLESKYSKDKEIEQKILKRFKIYNKNYDYVLKESTEVMNDLKLFKSLENDEIERLNEIENHLTKTVYKEEDYYILGRFERRYY